MNFTSFFSIQKSIASLVAIAAQSSNAGTVALTPIIMPQIQTIVRNITSTTPSSSSTGSKSTSAGGNDSKSKRVLEAKRIIQTADIVCFDVDSTVIMEEGIDELAEFCGKGEEVSNLTKEAMGGSMTFQEALRRRLDIIKPTQAQIRQFLMEKPSTLSPRIK